METRFYQAQGLNIERIAIELERMFLMQSYTVQHFGDANHTVVQFKKGGDFAAIVGMQAALTLTLQSTQGGVMAVIGQQKWADKAAAGAVGMLLLWPLAFTAGAGAIRQSNLSGQLLSALDAVVRQQNASVQASPVPYQMLPPQVQQQMVQAPQQAAVAPPPPPPVINQQPEPPAPLPPTQIAARPEQAPAGVRCPSCSHLNAADDIYCARCGKSLTPVQTKCPNCNAPIKPDAAFCTRCGTSFASPAQEKAAEATIPADLTPRTMIAPPELAATSVWGYLVLTNSEQLELAGPRITVGRALPGSRDEQPDINLYDAPQSGTVSRVHALIEHTQASQTVTDLNSTNLTRVRGQKLTPNTPVPLEDGDTCEFGHVKCTFKKA